ncbi:uncharacterized protein RAG0_01711 [Rhynchosporium agropyri]|uniref:Uncharacterized protein n=1 Tax=Rhynchosporium agropyri TaxID=914238 RepID=A0A1E1JYK7_9HELO|nr:uncharacterized protein RAG0_01711 [Rhynchosporium agropyri]
MILLLLLLLLLLFLLLLLLFSAVHDGRKTLDFNRTTDKHKGPKLRRVLKTFQSFDRAAQSLYPSQEIEVLKEHGYNGTVSPSQISSLSSGAPTSNLPEEVCDRFGHDWDGLCTAKVARLIFANGKGGLYLTRLVKIDERFMENSFSDIKILTYTLKEIQRLIDIFFADGKCPPMFFRNDELILPENPNPVGSVVDGNVVADGLSRTFCTGQGDRTCITRKSLVPTNL